ncbi:DNA polymerase-1 [Anaerosolibacter carboniphilus]|uniref:DNA polymerase I n=1 Tax=Anaerosolibacter carboniphilus TaxID=1417629 RepID=A0A841KNS3_9FIRM|nr:DNA polymerase I [Anaerosolibacter carboniphilus]MBB6214931.1 DNA polymerase-1 [Anaerosolibacter carboniphilus]
MTKKMVIIDGNSLINRAYYALPLLSSKSGDYTNAVYGFVNMLYKIMDDYRPDYISVAFDRKAPTFRHLEYDEYKAGRKKMPSELAQQLPILKDVLDALKIHRIELDGFEADDLIGTLVKYAENKELEAIVVTGDRDALQLASSKTKILITKKGISSLEEYDDKGVMERYEITPQQFIDLKGLMGDQSDNIPGVPGVGEKTAIKLIKEFGNIEELIQHTDKISSAKLREKIDEFAQQAIFSKRLATIMVDVPVEISLDELKREDPDSEKLMELFKRLEFHSLMGRVAVKNKMETTDSNFLDVKPTSVIFDWKSLKDKIKNTGELCIRTFTDGQDIIQDDIIGIHVRCGEEHFFIKGEDVPLALQDLKEILEDSRIRKYGHYLKRDRNSLKRYKIVLKGMAFDSAIALYLIDPTRSSYEIQDISLEYLNRKIESEEDVLGKGKSKTSFSELAEEKLIEFGMNWCNTVMSVKESLMEQMKEAELGVLFSDVEMPLVEVLSDMEFNGFMVDQSILDQLGTELDEKIQHITQSIYNEAGESFNINSPKQLGEILFDKLELPAVKKTKTGYSTNIEVLEKLQKKHPIIAMIIEYRQLVKLKSTYIDGLKAVINKETHKIHSSFNQTVTATGRISSTEPNLQNIPIKLALGREIRKVFIPSDEDYLLLDADYSQIELRVLAHISKDDNLIEAFHQDLDIHTSTASKVFGVPMEDVTSLQRSRAKAVNFGIVYGISDYGLSENLQITRKEAQLYIDEYFSRFTGVKRYMEEIVEEGRKLGYVTTLLKRRRYIPEISASNFNLRSFGERTAMNTPIQGSAADIIKLAMIKVDQELKRRKLKSRLILQVHDELIVEAHKSEIDEVKEIVKLQMENALNLDVPLKVDMNVGESWYDTK